MSHSLAEFIKYCQEGYLSPSFPFHILHSLFPFPPPVFVNKVLSEYNHTYLFTYAVAELAL